MKRAVMLLVGVGLLTGCQFRHVEREIIEIDGERFVCSKTVNQLSGNESEGECEPLAVKP